MIDVVNVTKKYGNFTAIENINCKTNKSSIFGLIGYNGAGKTTLLKTICGVLKPEQGEILLDGKPVFDCAETKNRIFFVPDELYMLPQASMKRMAKFFKGFYPKWNDNVFNKLASIFKLDINKRMNGFSKGMQRQAYIIFALSASPEYLLLDEAFDGIDPMMRDIVRQLLLEAIAEREVCIIISSHNLRELEDLCDRICVINGRQIAYDANIDDMRINKNKYKVVFAEDADASVIMDESGIKYRNLKRDGRIITFIADGPAEEITQKLADRNPILLETLPLTLEEIFLIEMEAQTYDFSDIFK